MQRRKFISRLTTAASFPVWAGSWSNPFSKNRKETPLIKPKRLSPGDTIGLVTPATYLTEEQLRKSVSQFESFGFKVYYSPNMLVRKGYLAGTDQQRAADINAMFADDPIDGIICGRGGYGSARILPYLDYDVIKSNPKVFMGYSDITALLFGIFRETGLVCFHGPMGTSDYNDFTTAHFKKVLMEPENQYIFKNDTPVEKTIITPQAHGFEIIEEEVAQTITPGKAEGPLAGGNLSLIAALSGTRYDLGFANKIIFIEDVGEEPYRIDRMLTQLLETEDKLKSAAGIVLGTFNDCEPKEPDRSLSLYEVLHDRLANLGIPVLYGLSFGHIARNLTIPFGIQARMDTETRSLTLLEKAVE